MSVLRSPLRGMLRSPLYSPLSGMWGSSSSLSAYAVNGYEPDTVADFVADYFRTLGADTDFDTMFNSPRQTGLCTMYDANGNLGYNPHNFITKSEDLTEWGTVGTLAGKTVDTLTDDATTGYHGISRGIGNGTIPSGERRIISAGVKGGTAAYACIGGYTAASSYVYATIDLATGLIENSGGSGVGTLHSATVRGQTSDGYWIVELDTTYGSANVSYTLSFSDDGTITDRGMKQYSGSGDTMMCKYMSVRWANAALNPDNEPALAGYMPTPALSQVYGLRRGSHVYDGSKWVNEGILIETEARTNMEISSKSPDDRFTDGMTRAESQPDRVGGNTAFSLMETATTSPHYQSINHTISVVSGTTYTVSADVEPIGSREIVGLIYGGGHFPANERRVFFRLTGDGSVEFSEVGTTGTIQKLDNGWYRISASSVANASGTQPTGMYAIGIDDGSGDGSGFPTYLGDINNGIRVDNINFEAAATPSMPIITYGATVTRAADPELQIADTLMTNPAAADRSSHFKGTLTFADTGGLSVGFGAWFVNTSNYLSYFADTTGADTGSLAVYQRASLTDLSEQPDDGTPAGVNVPVNASAYFGGAIRLATDGALHPLDATTTPLVNFTGWPFTVAGLTGVNWGGNGYMGNVGLFRDWAERIEDAGIESASQWPGTGPAPIDYSVNGFDPATVADFENDYYRVLGADSDFDTMFGSPRQTGLCTMYNAAGELVYNPHDLIGYTKLNTGWTKSNVTVTGDDITVLDGKLPLTKWESPSGGAGIHRLYRLTATGLAAGDKITTSFVAKAGVGNIDFIEVESRISSVTAYCWFDIANGVTSTTAGADAVRITEIETGTYLCEMDETLPDVAGNGYVYMPMSSRNNQYPNPDLNAGDYIHIGACTIRRRNTAVNPDLGFSFLENETGSGAYGLRRGHHIYNGTAWEPAGIAIETEARTNLFLNSQAPVTQGVTTVADDYTISFTGTGSITLSGSATGTINGTGTGNENRVYQTVTATAGTMTCTVSGTIADVQVEQAATPSLPIITNGATVTRAGDSVLTIPAANLDFPATSGAVSMQMDGQMTYADTNTTDEVEFWRWYSGANDYLEATLDTTSTDTGQPIFTHASTTDGVDSSSGSATAFAPGVNVAYNIAARYDAAEVNHAVAGTAGTVNTGPTVLPSLGSNDLEVGYSINGYTAQFRQWNDDIGDAGTEEATT